VLNDAFNSVDLGSEQTLSAFGSIAVSLAGALGTLSIVVFMSVYIAADRDGLLTRVRQAVPERYRRSLDISQAAIGRTFGGFVRGQVVMGIIYGLVAFGACIVLGLPYAPLVGVTVAILQTIPYFGQYVSWAPPVVVALVYQPAAVVPALVIMVVGLVLLANLIQPRVLGTAVGLSPLAVLVAVLVGGKLAGVLGAIFSIPFAAAALSIVHELRAEPEPQPAAAEAVRETQPAEAT